MLGSAAEGHGQQHIEAQNARHVHGRFTHGQAEFEDGSVAGNGSF